MSNFYQLPRTFKCDDELEGLIDDMIETAQGLLSVPLSQQQAVEIRQRVCTAWERYVSPSGVRASYSVAGDLAGSRPAAVEATIASVVEQTVALVMKRFLLERVQLEIRAYRPTFEWPSLVWEREA